MENIILNAHRGFAYLSILVVAIFVVTLLMGMFGYSGKITKLLKKSTLFTMILFHVQFLIGLVMLLVRSPFLDIIKSQGMGEIMKNEALRKSYIEHPFSMLIAAVLLTITYKKIKTSDKLNFGIVIMGFLGVALFLYAFFIMGSRLFG